jgi:hypothetical protein
MGFETNWRHILKGTRNKVSRQLETQMQNQGRKQKKIQRGTLALFQERPEKEVSS